MANEKIDLSALKDVFNQSMANAKAGRDTAHNMNSHGGDEVDPALGGILGFIVTLMVMLMAGVFIWVFTTIKIKKGTATEKTLYWNKRSKIFAILYLIGFIIMIIGLLFSGIGACVQLASGSLHLMI